MRNKIKYLLLLLSAVLCSCGLNPSEKQDTQVQIETDETDSTETDETESAETAIFKNSETTIKKNRLENDFIRIWLSEEESDYEEDEDGAWMQENLDGTGRQLLSAKNALGESVEEIFWLDNNWIYYNSLDEDYEDVLVRVPFHYDNKPVYDTENAEVLVKNFLEIASCMVTDSCMIYIDNDVLDNKVYKYDFNTKEKTVLLKADTVWILIDQTSLMPLTTDHSFFLLTSGMADADTDQLYRVSLDTMEKELIYTANPGSEKGSISNLAVLNDHSLYFQAPDENNAKEPAIMTYDGESGAVTCVLNHQEFKKIVEETKLLADVETPYVCDIFSIYLGCDRLYIHVYAHWTTEKSADEEPHKGETEELSYDREILLWSGLDDLKHWSMEEKLQNYVLEHSTPMVTSNYDYAYFNTNFTSENDAEANIYTLYIDKVLFTIVKDINGKNVEKEGFWDIDQTYMLYDIKSGEFEEIGSDDYRIAWNSNAEFY